MQKLVSQKWALLLGFALLAVLVSGCFQTAGASPDDSATSGLPTATVTVTSIPIVAPNSVPQPTIAQATLPPFPTIGVAVAQAPTTDPNQGANDEQTMVMATSNAMSTNIVLGITITAGSYQTLTATFAGTGLPADQSQNQPTQQQIQGATPIPGIPQTPQGTAGLAGSGAAGFISPDCIYTVVTGDRLFRIALRFNETTEEVARANGIVNPDLILPDQKFTIPFCNATPVPPGAINPANGVNGGKVYVVNQGDTLYAISVRYGTTVSALAQANAIANINLIYIGQTLTIP